MLTSHVNLRISTPPDSVAHYLSSSCKEVCGETIEWRLYPIGYGAKMAGGGEQPGTLLEMVKAMAQMERSSLGHPNTLAPIWIPKNSHDPCGAEYVMIVCPECLRTFPQVLGSSVRPVHETGCAHCSSLIRYAIVQSAGPPSLQALQRKPAARVPAPPSLHNLAAGE